MDKGAIKKFAVWARRELIDRVSQKARQYGITETDMVERGADSVNGRLLSAAEKRQRDALIAHIKQDGYRQVVERVAYTWFNRLCALRFMEVNGYLPSMVRVFTNDAGEFKPQILAEAIHLELDGLDRQRVFAFKEANQEEELYKYLLITQCNALGTILPGLFERIDDPAELLFPDHLLRAGSVAQRMVDDIPEEDWRDAVQIIGWLYQYYNTEPKDKVFANLKKNIKITKETIPAATQLFTPDWIVRYMVENSLGRLWVEGHPNDELKASWTYYLEEAEQEPQVEEQLAAIRAEYAKMSPEDIKVIDPCMGSGHILAYLFDVLVQIYTSYGYSTREAVTNIVTKNLHGVDIDKRATQLAYFSVMMKARQYDPNFFTRGLQPHLAYSTPVYNSYKAKELLGDTFASFLDNCAFADVAGLGSLRTEDYYTIENVDKILRNFDAFQYDLFDRKEILQMCAVAADGLKLADILSQKYDVVVTNPPYMGTSNMSQVLSDYVKKNYPDSKSDLFAVFIERCKEMTKELGYQAMITQHAWMFLSSFEKLRAKLMTSVDMVNMAHLGARAFDEIGGEVVQTTSFVLRKSHVTEYQGIYCRLIEPTTQQGKEDMFLSGKNRYTAQQANFSKIPGSPVAYWVNTHLISDFDQGIPFSEIGFPKVGMQTSNNDKFLRLWHEINAEEFFSGQKKWIKYVKGGTFRKWYGNLEYVVWYNGTPTFILQQKNARVLPESELTVLKCTWTDLATSRFSCRMAPVDSFHDISGHCFYPSPKNYYFLLALANSNVFQFIIDFLNSSLHYQVGDVARVPVLISNKEMADNLSQVNVELSKADWNSFETSWDFKRNPLV